MSKQATNTEPVLLPEDLVPISLIAVETGNSVEWVANRFSEEVTVDDIGMRAIPAFVARQFFTEKAAERARRIEEQRRRAEEHAQRKVVVPAGVPAQDGLSPVEAMVSNDPAFSTPQQDFGRTFGSPTRELLDAELAEGQRDIAKKRAETAEKQRLAKQMRKDLK